VPICCAARASPRRGDGTPNRLDRLADDFAAVHLTARTGERDECGGLDNHVEAQVHGVVWLRTDVEAVVLDAAYRGTEVAGQADRLGVFVQCTRDASLTSRSSTATHGSGEGRLVPAPTGV
jgi:hypothetical protein